jgi:hypothetical protein
MFKHGQEDARGPRTYGMDGMAPGSERTGRRRLRKRHFTMVAAAIAGAVLLPAGSAMATSAALVPSTFVVVTQGVAVPVNTDLGDFLKARCPAGTQVVAAGAITGGSIKGLSIQGSPAEMAILDVGVNAGNSSFALAQATCAPSAQLAGSHILTNDGFNHTRNPTFTLTTNCPAGEIAIGGGAVVLNSDNSRVIAEMDTFANTLTNDGRGWTVTIKDSTNNRFAPHKVSEKVRCIPGPLPGQKQTVIKETVFPLVPSAGQPGFARASGTSPCPSGTLPITGGASITGNERVLGSAGLDSSTFVLGGWSAGAEADLTPGTPAALHVIVRCG